MFTALDSMPLPDRRSAVVWLRWLLTIALSYLMLFHTGRLALSWQASIVISFSMVVNVGTMLLRRNMYESTGFMRALILVDTLTVSGAMAITGFATSYLLLFYFLIMLMSTMPRQGGAAIGNILVMVGVYVWSLLQTHGTEILQRSDLLLQVPFLFISGVFYVILAQTRRADQLAIIEHERQEQQLLATARELEHLVAERTAKLHSTNRKLLEEIDERKQAEAALRDSESALERRVEDRTAALQQVNQELKIAVERTRKLADIADSASRAKSEFLANVSHEIRTPMSAIVGLTELLEEAGPTSRQQAYLTKLRLATHVLLGLIDDILDLSKIEAGKLKLECIELDVRNVVGAVTEMFVDQASQKGISLSAHVDEAIPAILVGDPLRLSQVIINLTSNAVKFTDKGEVTIEVDCAERTDGQVTLTCCVRDTGVGIDTTELPRLFQAFTQSDGSTTRRFGGSGLGLAITKRLVALMGGDVTVRSQPGQGSSFQFSATLGAVPPPAETATKSAQQRRQQAPRRGTRVLLVEDDPMTRDVVEELLCGSGLAVQACDSGPAAIATLRGASSAPFEVVLMDVHMPQMDGLQATEQIRKDDRLHALPIIAMTANAMPDDRRQCLEAGMNDYLSKPVSRAELLTMLAKWTAQQPTERETAVTAAGTQQQEAGEPCEPPPGVFDVDSLLQRFNGNEAVIREFFLRFARDYADTADKIEQALHDGERQDAERLAHTIKGLGANLSAEGLRQAAGQLERALKSSAEDSVRQPLDSFRTTLDQAVRTAQTLSETHRPWPSGPAENGRTS